MTNALDTVMQGFFYPESVAIVGFSPREGNQGQSVLTNLLAYGYPGRIHLVGRSAGEYQGRSIAASVAELPERPDLAVIVTGARAAPGALEACGQAGIKAACIISSGFDEFTPGGSPLTQALREIAARWDIRFTGPNGFGVVNVPANLFTPFGNMTPDWLAAGRVSVISQSGALLLHMGIVLTTGGLGVAKGVSMGNKVNLNETDFLPYVLQDDATGIVWLYLESFADGRKLLEQARSAAKPILMLKSGRTTASRQALQSHSAALATDDRAVDALARQANIVRLPDFRRMVEVSKAFSAPPVRGNRLLVFARSGGTGVMAVDEAEAHGFRLIDIPDWYAGEFGHHFNTDVTQISNPIDLGTIFSVDAWLRLVEAGCERLAADAVILSYNSSPIWKDRETPRLTQGLRDLARRLEIPLVLVISAGAQEVGALERDLGVPVYREIGDAIQSLAAARDWQQRRSALAAEGFSAVMPEGTEAPLETSPLLPEALALIEAYGIRSAPWAVARTAEEAVAAARMLGYPVALKAVSAQISHKTDLGGVMLNIADEPELRRAWADIRARLQAQAPAAHVAQFLLQRMAGGGREMIVGARRDPTFGPVVLLGLGGVYAEVFDDVSLRIAPLTAFDAGEMIVELRSSRLLAGVRGEKPLDIEALKRSLLAVSRLMLDHPEIRELDINPLLVRPEGVLALDARIVAG